MAAEQAAIFARKNFTQPGAFAPWLFCIVTFFGNLRFG
jgi:hypothetical protein